MSENARPNRTSLWLIMALCAAPVIASYLTYYFFLPRSQVNYGELLETRPLPPAALKLIDGTAFSVERLRGKWLLIMTAGGTCDEACRKNLFALRQLRTSQGRERERLERLWLITDAGTPPSDLLQEYTGTWMVRAGGSPLAQTLQAGYLYLADPLGNLVLRYPQDADPARIIKDLTRLLKVSQIG